MASDNNLILNLPFDENSGSEKAYDYASNRHDATVEGADFIAGKQGNCIHFDGGGSATIDTSFMTLTGNFTVLAWIKPTTYADGYTGGNRIGFLFNTSALNGAQVVWLDVLADSWGFYVIRKKGNTINIYQDTQLKASLTMTATALIGFAIFQDIYGTDLAVADLDEVKIYDTALTEDEITESLNSVSQLAYYIDGTNLADIGIRVSASSGVIDLPKLKTPTTIDWPDYHGKVIDLTDKRYEEREITLSCWLKATGKMDFFTRVDSLHRLFTGDGTARLMIAIHPTKPLVYEVYNADGISHDKKWHDDKMIGTFSLKLKEPDPVKRVLRHQRANASSAKLTIGLKVDSLVNVYWGDGSVDYDVTGDHTGDNALTHTYAENGIYYPIIGGIIDDISNFTTNAIVVWDKI